MRLLFVQFGDYREAYNRLSTGGKETYFAQKYTVSWVSNFAKECEYLGVLCVAAENYDELLSNGVHAMGLRYENNIEAVFQKIKAANPTDIICCTPLRPVLKWAIENNVRTLPLLADSFKKGGFKKWWQHYRLKSLLNQFDWVANHNRNACKSLLNIGVDPKKVIAWDYPAFISPKEYPAKTLENSSIRLLYVGSISETKGVGTAIEALKKLRESDVEAFLTIAGPGDFSAFAALSEKLGVKVYVNYLGTITHEQVLSLMREHTIVLVPSWHEYPEGLPLTIYEGLCSRTPLIVSDHPMFLGNIVDGFSGLIFKSKNSASLAEAVLKLINDPELYRSLSENALPAWEKLQIPVKWNELIERWLNRDEGWLESNRFKA